MKLHDVEQGSPEWMALRCAIPTASEFSKIITASGTLSQQAPKLRNLLLANWLIGEPVDEFRSKWMDRGNELEPEACDYYSIITSLPAETVGFMTLDDELVGASPDRLVLDDGCLEVKCPSPQVHIQYLLDQRVPSIYFPQVQGQLWISGRQWCDWFSYHPDMKPVRIRVQRDDVFIGRLASAMDLFVRDMLKCRQRLVDEGVAPPGIEVTPASAEAESESPARGMFGG